MTLAGGDIKTCGGCGEAFRRKSKVGATQWRTTRYCSMRCLRQHAVARAIAGETLLHTKGYVLVFCPWHPSARSSYVYKHRLVMERQLGRLLHSNEHVHHINEDMTDNRPENLAVVTSSQHQIMHGNGISDERVAEMIRRGLTSRQIAAMGVSTNRIVRVRRQLVAT